MDVNLQYGTKNDKNIGANCRPRHVINIRHIGNIKEWGIAMSMANRPTKRQLKEFDDLRKITKQLMKDKGIKSIKFVPVHIKYNKKENDNEKERD